LGILKNRRVLAWAFYDWANSAFATTVLAGFFPVFFKQYWGAELAATESTFWLGAASSFAALVVALSAPALGAIADAGGRRKSFLASFATFGVLSTAAMFWVAQGAWEVAALLYVLGTIGFAGGNVFYDAMLLDVAEPSEYDRVSTVGYSFGYLGGGLLFAGQVLVTQKPEWFGLTSAAEGVRWAFLTCAAWWAIFALPLFKWVSEASQSDTVPLVSAAREGFRELVSTFREIRALKPVLYFLLAYWLYIDGVHTVIKMAVDYGLALGFPSSSLILALLITQFVGFPAALAYGPLANRFGTKNMIMVAIAVYIGVSVLGTQLTTVTHFYLMAGVIGLAQGGVQALSRAYFGRFVPAGKGAQFYGFFNMLGKFASVLGPLLVGWVTLVSGNQRFGILSISILLLAGLLLLARVPEPAAGTQT
jgi:UMF1 family MFS transporter